MAVKHFIIQPMYSIYYADTIKIIKYLKAVPSYTANYTHAQRSEYAAITPTLSMSTDTIESFL